MRSREHDLLTALWDRHADDVYAYARRRVGDTAAPDVVADVFTVAVQHPDRLPPDALPWLYGVARNVIANARRADHRRSTTWASFAREWSRAAEDPAVVVSERAALFDALASLSDDDREALLLTTWEGLSSARAARAAGCSVGAFAVRLHRARRKFEQALEPPAPEPPTPDALLVLGEAT